MWINFWRTEKKRILCHDIMQIANCCIHFYHRLKIVVRVHTLLSIVAVVAQAQLEIANNIILSNTISEYAPY